MHTEGRGRRGDRHARREGIKKGQTCKGEVKSRHVRGGVEVRHVRGG